LSSSKSGVGDRLPDSGTTTSWQVTTWQAFVAPDEGRADLWAPLDTLTVDEAALRAKAGFETEPSAQDIAGTRNNMMGRVLETDRHPYALIAVSDLTSGGSSIRLRIDIALHGTTRSLETDAEFERTEDELSVSGLIPIDQSEFGIVPLSVLGGAIAVQDRLNMSYRIRAFEHSSPAGA
jgi:hypothetical protein